MTPCAPSKDQGLDTMIGSQGVRAYGLLLAGGICLGLSPVIVKALPFSADVSAFYRVALSAPVFLAFALALPSPAPRPDASVKSGPPLWLYACAAGLFAADLLAMHVSIRLTNASVATLFTNCAPFFVGVLGLLGLSDRPQRSFWTALPIALSGTVLILGLSAFSEGSDFAGNLIALLAGAAYGAYLVAIRRLKQAGAKTSVIMVWVTAGSALLLLPLFLLQGAPIPADTTSALLLAALVLVGQVAGQGLVTIALRSLSTSSSSIVLLIQPVVSAPIAWIVLGDSLSALQMVGMALVLASIAQVTLAARKEPAPVS